MAHRYSRYITIISLTGDYLLLNLLFVVAFWLESDFRVFGAKYILFYLYLNISWLSLIIIFGAYRMSRNTQKKAILFTYLKIIIFFFFLFLMFFQIVSLAYYPRTFIKYLFPAFFALLIIWKYTLYYSFLLYRKRGFNYRNVLIIGYSVKSDELYQYFSNNIWHGYRCLGFIDEKSDDSGQILGNWNDLNKIIRNLEIDEVYLALEAIPKEKLSAITEVLSNFPLKIRIVTDLGNFSNKNIELAIYGNIPVIEIHPGPLSFWYNKLLKRAFDLFVSTFVIVIILSWLTPLLIFISFLTDRKGVFFRQSRTSIEGKEFTILKYRSMTINADADIKEAKHNDERITSLGRLLRKTSLDELPQFYNVFVGTMSVVGPRPHMLAHTEQYRKIVKHFMLRHAVKPGITGLAQINGYRGEIRKLSDIKNRVELDVQYIKNWSFTFDMKIIALTFWVLIRGQKEAY
ncbi:MAG: exopolysaccharide biosynthesis polyprenyl glycosylphosphotransferase [Bacteroidales bacterium]|nr:exopolysaccharide biosynthesis polyprenyl glycosylphosphotransferase [Bacteroidales bacterium]